MTGRGIFCLLLTYAAVASAAPSQDFESYKGPSAAGVSGPPHLCDSYYPADEKAAKHQGATLLDFTVTVEGGVSGIKVAKTSGYPALDDAALACVRRWRYRPAEQNGHPVQARWNELVSWTISPFPSSSSLFQGAESKLQWDVSNCVKKAASDFSFSDDFDGKTVVSIRFREGLPPDVSLTQKSGNQEVDDRTLICTLNSRFLADLDRKKSLIPPRLSMGWWWGSILNRKTTVVSPQD